MISKQISYADLSEKVRDMVLFNNHTEAEDDWISGLIESPHVTARLEALDEESRAEAQKAIDEATDEGERAKLTEELDDIETHGMYDLCESIYQTYAITPEGARYLFNHTGEIISYSEKLDLFLWHISHYGTSWTHVYTMVHDWKSEETPDWYAYDTEQIIKYTIG